MMNKKPIGEIVLSEPDDVGYRSASVVCLHEQADWDNFPDGTKLYLTPSPFVSGKDREIMVAELMTCKDMVRSNLERAFSMRDEKSVKLLDTIHGVLMRSIETIEKM